MKRLMTAAALVCVCNLLPETSFGQCDDWRAGPLQNDQSVNGANATVRALTVWDPDGAGPQPPMLVAAGNFTRMQDATVHHVAALDPLTGQWQSVGDPASSPFAAEVRCLSVFNNELIAGSDQIQSIDGRAFRWDGSDWQPMDSDFCMPTFTNMTPLYLRCFAPYQGALYSGGNFTGWFSDTSTGCHGQFGWGLSQWDGSAHWTRPSDAFWAGADVLAMMQYGGRLIIGGEFAFNTCSCNPGNHIAAWDGTGWSTMAEGVNNDVLSLGIYNGDLIVGGGFTTAGGVTVSNIARWDGTSWHAMGTGLNGAVTCLRAYGSDLIAGGTFTMAGSLTVNHIARWNGSTWNAMGFGVNSVVDALTTYNSDLIVGGDFTSADGRTANRIARWDGTQWSSFGGGAVTNVFAMTQFNSRVIAGGDFQQSGDTTQPALDIVSWNGLHLSTLGSGMNLPVRALKTYTTGIGIGQVAHLLAGGEFTSAGGVSANRIAHWSEGVTGLIQPWSALGPGFNNTVQTIERFNNIIIAGGLFTATSNNATTLAHIAQWNGTSWSQLGTGLNGACFALKVYNGSLYAGGNFTFASGTVHTGGLARWDGSTWNVVGGTFAGTVNSLEVYNGDLIIGGLYPGISGSPNIARYNSVSGAYSTLATGGTDGAVDALLVEGGNLYVGGAFTLAGGITANHLARWNGTAWSSVRGGTDNSVFALTAYHNEVHAGGSFMNVRSGVIPSPAWARYLETGAPWVAQNPISIEGTCNDEVSITAHGAVGYSLNYTWRHNGVPLVDGPTGTGSIIGGAHNATIDIAHISSADTGAYDLALSNGCGSATSIAASLTVDGNGPTILTSPSSASTCVSGSPVFSVVASGDAPLNYQWEIETNPGVWAPLSATPLPLPCGGTALAQNAATSSPLIGVRGCTGVFHIHCIVSNACGSVTSATASLHACDFAADVNCDGQVDLTDLAVVLSHFGSTSATPNQGDLTGDGIVDLTDLAIMLSAFGATCP